MVARRNLQPRPIGARSSSHAAFAARLRQAMEYRGHHRASLAAALDVTPTMVGYWRSGRYLPPLTVAERMTDLLDDTWLLKMVMKARVMRCPNCGTTFDRGQTRRRYCTTTCQRLAHLKGGKKFADPRQEAIDAMCAGCEPEGTCRDDACALRPFSPLVFVPLHRRSAA